MKREFNPGEKVLLLLLSNNNKLLAQCQGLYEVLQRVGLAEDEIVRLGQVRVTSKPFKRMEETRGLVDDP